MKVENMKNYEYEEWLDEKYLSPDYSTDEEWLDSNYLTADYTDEELDDLYKICMKMMSFLKLTKNPGGMR